VVDHLPREPARPRARPGQVLSKRLLLVGLIAVALVAMVRALGFTDLVRLDNVVRLREWIAGFGAWAPAVFVGGYPIPHFKQAKPISLSL